MTKKEKKQENLLIKIYLIALFLCGIGLWFALTASPKDDKISVDVEVEQKVVDALSAGGVKQSDVISQYAKERETSSMQWNEFYKKIQLRDSKKPEHFENSFRAIARSTKLGLSKTDNVDGTVTYRFYSKNRNYSNVTFVSARKAVYSEQTKTKNKQPEQVN